jgi:hypothetical protein
LDGRWLSFVGDSITRYQYLSLAHLVSHMAVPERYGCARGRPSIGIEEEWSDGWDSFYPGITECACSGLHV